MTRPILLACLLSLLCTVARAETAFDPKVLIESRGKRYWQMLQADAKAGKLSDKDLNAAGWVLFSVETDIDRAYKAKDSAAGKKLEELEMKMATAQVTVAAAKDQEKQLAAALPVPSKADLDEAAAGALAGRLKGSSEHQKEVADASYAQELKDLQPAINALTAWVAAKVAESRQPYCYRDSYGRGVGAPLSTCDSGQEKDGLLCYPKCKDGYGGAGPVCWHNCPSGYADTGAFCHIDKALTKDGSWHCPKWYNCRKECPSGYTNAGAFCALNTPSTPSGWSGDGLDLTKDSYGRGAGYPMKCASGQEEDAALCYPYCKDGYKGVGPVCWQKCSQGMTPCGAGCADSAKTCVEDTTKMVVAPAMMVANIYTLGGAGKAEEAGEAATDASLIGKLKSKYDEIKTAYKDEMALAKAAGKTARIGRKTADIIDAWTADAAGDFKVMTSPAIVKQLDQAFAGHAAAEEQFKKAFVRQNLAVMLKQDNIDITVKDSIDIVSMADPTGVLSVVSAYTNPKCKVVDPMPDVSKLFSWWSPADKF